MRFSIILEQTTSFIIRVIFSATSCVMLLRRRMR
ncbi:hypothetical protein BVRB_9g222930 [Beta vulgaris subsp. vulgaris]|nr:hypothetical protein BVRB_9g222930 [Beta vulgaris subsp. vulgaris]